MDDDLFTAPAQDRAEGGEPGEQLTALLPLIRNRFWVSWCGYVGLVMVVIGGATFLFGETRFGGPGSMVLVGAVLLVWLALALSLVVAGAALGRARRDRSAESGARASARLVIFFRTIGIVTMLYVAIVIAVMVIALIGAFGR